MYVTQKDQLLDPGNNSKQCLMLVLQIFNTEIFSFELEIWKKQKCQKFNIECSFLIVDFFYHQWTKGVYNTLYQRCIPFAESRRVVLNARMRELLAIISEAGYTYGYHRHGVVRNWFTWSKEFSCDCTT